MPCRLAKVVELLLLLAHPVEGVELAGVRERVQAEGPACM